MESTTKEGFDKFIEDYLIKRPQATGQLMGDVCHITTPPMYRVFDLSTDDKIVIATAIFSELRKLEDYKIKTDL